MKHRISKLESSSPVQPSLGWTLLLLIALPGCGGTSVVEHPGHGAGGADGGTTIVLPPDAGAALPGCEAPLLVPSGRAWIGELAVDVDATLIALDCSAGLAGSKRLTVHPFFLDADETTNACYRSCFDAGACPPPIEPATDPSTEPWTDLARASFPVAADRNLAEAFCAFRGGRLPSYAELARATQGDYLGVSTAEIFAAWTSCTASNFSGDDCDALWARVSSVPRAPIRSSADDVGPFGHYDLFGSQMELSQTIVQLAPAEVAAYCGIADGENDPKTFGSLSQGLMAFAPARALAVLPAPPVAPHISTIGSALIDPNDELPFAKGIRCAYDPAP